MRFPAGTLFAPLIFILVLCSAAPSPARAQSHRAALEFPGVQVLALQLAREALGAHLRGEPRPALPQNLPAALRKRGGVIVTLEMPGKVAPRGCRGTLSPAYGNLAEEIQRNAVAAATRDQRVSPLRAAELPRCRISLTFILNIKPLRSLAQHDTARNGLLARRGQRLGLVLPYEGRDAATRWRWARQKAGLHPEERAEMLEVTAVRCKEAAQ